MLLIFMGTCQNVCMFQMQQFQLVLSGDDETWNIMQQRLNGDVSQTTIV